MHKLGVPNKRTQVLGPLKSRCPHFFHTRAYICFWHLAVVHLHLNIDVLSLLVLIQRAIVPHEEVKGWVELSDIVCAPDPGLFLTMGGKAVATVRVASSHNKHIIRDGLKGRRGLFMSMFNKYNTM